MTSIRTSSSTSPSCSRKRRPAAADCPTPPKNQRPAPKTPQTTWRSPWTSCSCTTADSRKQQPEPPWSGSEPGTRKNGRCGSRSTERPRIPSARSSRASTSSERRCGSSPRRHRSPRRPEGPEGPHPKEGREERDASPRHQRRVNLKPRAPHSGDTRTSAGTGTTGGAPSHAHRAGSTHATRSSQAEATAGRRGTRRRPAGTSNREAQRRNWPEPQLGSETGSSHNPRWPSTSCAASTRQSCGHSSGADGKSSHGTSASFKTWT